MAYAHDRIAELLLREWGMAPDAELSTGEAAFLLGYHSAALRNARSQGRPPKYIMRGCCARYRAYDLAEYAASRIPGLEYATNHTGA